MTKLETKRNPSNASINRVSDYFLDQRNLCQPHKGIWMEHLDFSQFSHDFKEGLTKKI